MDSSQEAADCWSLFDPVTDEPIASSERVGSVMAQQFGDSERFSVVTGVPAAEHSYFQSFSDLAPPEIADLEGLLRDAVEEFVPTACELLPAVLTSEGLVLSSRLDAAFAAFRSLPEKECLNRCEAASRACAGEAWLQLRKGVVHEVILHAHAFAHAMLSYCLLFRATLLEEGDGDVARYLSGAIRHADLALLICPILPISALRGLRSFCDNEFRKLHSKSALNDSIHTSAEGTWLFPSYLPASDKVPSLHHRILRESCTDLSVARFRKEFLQSTKPLIIEGHIAAAGWIACKRWADLRFWRHSHGHRSVPIELGLCEGDSANTDLASSTESEGSTLISEFVDRYLLPSNAATLSGTQLQRSSEPRDEWTASPVAYLAQHLLLHQIPDLLGDIAVPHYCALGSLRTVNVWMGTAGTVTALHHDEDDNLLVQVAGFKYIRLYAPSQSHRLYATSALRSGEATRMRHGASFSPVRVEYPDAALHSEFLEAPYEETILQPGETLFIPRYTWHYIRSLTTSISVNFWF